MFGLSFLPLSYSGTKQLNGIQSHIILNVLQNKDIAFSIERVINIELYIERDETIIL